VAPQGELPARGGGPKLHRNRGIVNSVRAQTLVSCVYGELRGYRRLAIRRTVAANERLSREALRDASDVAFRQCVRNAIARFPYYADRVRAHRGSLPGSAEHVRSEELPVWTRRDQREFFSKQERPPDAAYIHQTGGSTGLPIRFHVTRDSYEWRTAVTDRAYGWARAEEGRRSVYVWADLATATYAKHLKRRLQRALQRRTYFHALQQFTDAERLACCQLIDRVKPDALVGYSGRLVDIARYVRDHPGVLSWKSPTLVCAAEGLHPSQRPLLEEHLAGDVYLSYGSREFMSVGMECEHHQGYHINSDNVLVEVVDKSGAPLPPGTEGRIVITDLHNPATPFIRYEIGDIGIVAPDEPCPCGRPFPLLKSVEGRTQDVVYTPEGIVSGLYVTWAMWQFDSWIEGYQVVQRTKDRVDIRLLTTAPLTPERLAPVTALLRKELGNTIQIEYERASELERGRTGKIALVVSSVEEER